jgi:hypothetical protein
MGVSWVDQVIDLGISVSALRDFDAGKGEKLFHMVLQWSCRKGIPIEWAELKRQ